MRDDRRTLHGRNKDESHWSCTFSLSLLSNDDLSRFCQEFGEIILPLFGVISHFGKIKPKLTEPTKLQCLMLLPVIYSTSGRGSLLDLVHFPVLTSCYYLHLIVTKRNTRARSKRREIMLTCFFLLKKICILLLRRIREDPEATAGNFMGASGDSVWSRDQEL